MASNAVKNLGERLNRSNTDYTFQFSKKETLLIIIEHNYKSKATQLATSMVKHLNGHCCVSHFNASRYSSLSVVC